MVAKNHFYRKKATSITRLKMNINYFYLHSYAKQTQKSITALNSHVNKEPKVEFFGNFSLLDTSTATANATKEESCSMSIHST